MKASTLLFLIFAGSAVPLILGPLAASSWVFISLGWLILGGILICTLVIIAAACSAKEPAPSHDVEIRECGVCGQPFVVEPGSEICGVCRSREEVYEQRHTRAN